MYVLVAIELLNVCFDNVNCAQQPHSSGQARHFDKFKPAVSRQTIPIDEIPEVIVRTGYD
jgi:hypothetical protein